MGRMKALLLLFGATLATASADPQLTSWFTTNSGKYARLFTSSANESAGVSVTTWSRGAGVQTQPTYAGVNEISFSNNYVYIRTTGLASHVMGPWYLDAGKTQNFPNFPSNTAKIFRFPRTPNIPATKTNTGGGATGYFVNGVALFDMRDTFSYSNANGTDATPAGGIGNGDGIWNREAYANEGVTFDAALAHQAGNQYHYHAQSIAVRHQLDDHVEYNPTTNRYSESATAVTKHSPILAWAGDGLPIYGPYGYSSPLDAGSGLRRMVSGFVKRDGANGTTNLNTVGRRTLPAWAARVQNRPATLAANQYGPNVNATYALGHYLEDYDYLGDLGQMQGPPGTGTFDLNEWNARFCVTPEFPEGTWAYFTTIHADGSPAYPFNMGRQYFGSPTGGEVGSITETVIQHFSGGPNMPIAFTALSRNSGTGVVTGAWSSVDGGTYKVESASNGGTWSDLQTGVTSGGITTAFVDNTAAGITSRIYRASRTALAAYDSTGYGSTGGGGGGNSVAPGGSAARGTTVTVTITLPANPPQPPAALLPTSVTLAGTIAGTSISRPAAGTVLATFAIPANAPTGAQNVVVTFNPAPTYTLTGGFTINP
jgi:hypothetical protein